MTQWLRGCSRGPKVALLASWVAVLLMGAQAAPAMAQAADSKARLILSMKPLNERELGMPDPLRRSDAWLLRPNVPQELLTYVEIDEPAKKPTVTVQLLAGGVEVASQTLKAVEAKYTQVKWPRLDAGANNSAKLTPLMNPVELRLLLDGKLSGAPIKLDIYRPGDYLKCSFDPTEGANKNRLVAEIQPNKKVADPRYLSPEPSCRVELIPNPAHLYDPAFVVRRRTSAGNIILEKDSKPLYLLAEGFDPRPDKVRSLVSLSADGFNRAFLYYMTSERSGSSLAVSRITDNNLLRLNAPRYADPRKSVGLTFEADQVADPDSKRLVLDVLTFVDKKGDKHFSRLAESRGDRDIRWSFTGGGRQGGLQLQPDVKDWGREVDLSGLHGKVTLRLRLLDEKNTSMEVLDPDKEEWRSTPEGVSRTITLDDTPPAVRFEKLPRPAVRTKPFVVEARGIDEESGIRDVVFFLGRIPGNAAVPPEAIARPGRQLKKDGPWVTELVVPSDARSPLDLSVRFTNNVGLYTTEVIPLEVADPPPPGLKVAKKGSIAGVVVEGERPQKGLKVDLLDPAGKVLLSTNTAADGAYVFRDLLPGDYRVSSAKTASNTAGVTPRPPLPPLALGEGEDKVGVAIKLWRRPSAVR